MRDTTFFHFSKLFLIQNYRFLYHGDQKISWWTLHSGTLTSGWGIPAGCHPENSLFGNQHMGFFSCYEEDDKRVVVPGLGG